MTNLYSVPAKVSIVASGKWKKPMGAVGDCTVLHSPTGCFQQCVIGGNMLMFLEGGDIHIWDRESAALLHHIRAQALGGGDLTCIAWNHHANPFIFATGSHDGAVRIWTESSGKPSSSDELPSRSTTHPTNTPRTASPSLYDADYRADSPAGTSGSQDGHHDIVVTSPEEEYFRRDNGKAVAFATPS